MVILLLMSFVTLMAGAEVQRADKDDAPLTVREAVALGFQYLNGDRVEQNDTRAAEYFRYAADRGDTTAMVRLALLHLSGRGVVQNDYEAVRLYERAAEAGDVYSMMSLGFLYAVGRGLPRDADKAAVWFRRAADRGDAYSLCMLGRFAERGQGTDRDPAFALECFERSAEAGYMRAAVAAARMLIEGDGVEADAERAARWIARVENSDDAVSLALLAREHVAGVTFEQNDDRAVALFRRAAELGYEDAWYMLGRMALAGRIPGEGYPEAGEYLRLSAEGGDRDGMPLYARFLGTGGSNNVADFDGALEWYYRTIEFGHREGMTELGLALVEGVGIEQDVEKGAAWLLLASQANELDAAMYLGALEATGQRRGNGIARLRDAAGDGHAASMVLLGLLGLSPVDWGVDREEAADWLRRATWHRSYHAMVILGWAMREGLIEETEEGEAAAWLEKGSRGVRGSLPNVFDPEPNVELHGGEAVRMLADESVHSLGPDLAELLGGAFPPMQ